MMHPYSPSSRRLAVPGIGFPQSFSDDRNVIDLAAYRYGERAVSSTGRKLPSEIERTDDQDKPRRQLTAGLAAALVLMAVIVGSVVTWLLLRTAPVAS